jgi:hypothetical protein
VGYAHGIPASSRAIVVWLRWCCSSLAARSGGFGEDEGGPFGSGRVADIVARTFVMVIVEELADVVLDNSSASCRNRI